MKIVAKLWFGDLTPDLEQVGKTVEAKILDSLSLQPVEKFADLVELKDLKGEVTGYVKVYTGDKLDRLTFLSIDIAPGMRYFNVHVIPDHRYQIPRYSHEGMVTTRGSLVSADLYPDVDPILQYEQLEAAFSGIDKIYNKAKKHKRINFTASRLPHMRMMCSPYFLRADKVTAEDVGEFEGFALDYLDEWLQMYHGAQELPEAEAQDRLTRRKQMGHIIQTRDPDRGMVVKTYGEETTRAMEEASFL